MWLAMKGKALFLCVAILIMVMVTPYPSALGKRPSEIINVEWIKGVETISGVLFPRIGLPAFVSPGKNFNIVLYAPKFSSGVDRLYIKYVSLEFDLRVLEEKKVGDKLILNVSIPDEVPSALYDLFVVSGGEAIKEPNSVAIKQSWDYPLKILRYSDTHYDNRRSGIQQRDNFLKLIWKANFLHPDFVIITGDILNTATDDNYKSFRNDIDNLLRVPLVLVPGNHDHHYQKDLFTYYVGLSNISINIGPLHLILIDTGPNGMNGWIKNTQINWLKDDLSRYGDYEVKIIASHHPFSMLEESPESNRSGLEKILRKSDVDLILHGHMHYLMAELNMTPIRITDPNSYEGGQPYSGFRLIFINGPHQIEWKYNGKVDPYPLFDLDVVEYQRPSPKSDGYSLKVVNNMEVDVEGTIDVTLPLKKIAAVDGISLSQLKIINYTDFMRIYGKITVKSGEEKIVKIYLREDKEPPSINKVDLIERGKSILVYINISDSVSGVSKVEVKYSYDNLTWEDKDVLRLTYTLFYTDIRLPDEGGGVGIIIKARDVEGNTVTRFVNHSLIMSSRVGEESTGSVENLLTYIALIVIIAGVASVLIYVVRKR